MSGPNFPPLLKEDSCAGELKDSGISREEMMRQIEEAKAQVQAESDESVSDLLVCLGQEERKVEILKERLEQMGVNADALIENVSGSADENAVLEDFS